MILIMIVIKTQIVIECFRGKFFLNSKELLNIKRVKAFSTDDHLSKIADTNIETQGFNNKYQNL